MHDSMQQHTTSNNNNPQENTNFANSKIASDDPGVQTTATETGGTKQTKNIGKYKVEVIREKCISAASCAAIAPNVFEMDEEDLAVVISQDGNDDETKLLAAQSCPTFAIIVTDTQTGKQVWPPV